MNDMPVGPEPVLNSGPAPGAPDIAPSRSSPVSAEARNALRAACAAGGDQGCSCADLNYQWYGPSCEATMTSVFRTMMAGQPSARSSAEMERPPCPRCSFPYEPGSAERYWEARWRDEKAENDRLRGAAQPSADIEMAGAWVNSAYDELCVRFSGVHSDDAMDSVLLRLHAALKKLGIDPTAPYIAPDAPSQAAPGCGTPGCADPNCEYGKGPTIAQIEAGARAIADHLTAADGGELAAKWIRIAQHHENVASLIDQETGDGAEESALHRATAETLRKCASELVQLPAGQAWSPMETAPGDMSPVLVFVPGNRFGGLQEEPDTIHIAFLKRGAYYLQEDGYSIVKPTHWMHLPEGPALSFPHHDGTAE